MIIGNRIHNHPKMERDKGLDDNHVIIDKELYIELLKKYGDKLIRSERALYD